MNIIFMGTPAFAVPSLKALLQSQDVRRVAPPATKQSFKSKHTISAVVTAPDKPRGRGLHLAESEVKKFASSHDLKILQPESLKDEKFAQEIEGLKPDLIVVVAFRILPKEIFTIPHFGSINLHASLLPKYRGAAPINWAIIKGEKETGVTTFFLKEKVDTGNIILQRRCEISENDNAGSLHDKLSMLGAEAVSETIDMIEGGNVKVSIQDGTKATPAPKFTPEMCRINWNDSASNIHNFIRGLSPFPGAYTLHGESKIKIFKTGISPSRGAGMVSVPGSIQISDGRLLITCSDGALQILELQLEGRKRLPAEEFLRGYRFKENDKFEQQGFPL